MPNRSFNIIVRLALLLCFTALANPGISLARTQDYIHGPAVRAVEPAPFRIMEPVAPRLQASDSSEQDRLEALQLAEADALRTQFLLKIAEFGVPSLALIALFVYLNLRFRRVRQASSRVLAQWRDNVRKSQELYAKLSKAYLIFVAAQPERLTLLEPEGLTDKRYRETLSSFADLCRRTHAAESLLSLAEQAFNSTDGPSISGFARVVSLVRTDEMSLNDSHILESEAILKGLLAERKLYPVQLLSDQEAAFSKVSLELAQIKQAFDVTTESRAKLNVLLSDLDGLKSKFAELGLRVAVGDNLYTSLSRELGKRIAIIDRDPLLAFASAQPVEANFDLLKTEIAQAVELCGALSHVDRDLCDAQDTIDEMRSRDVQFAYPGTATSEAGSSEKFLLVAESGFSLDESVERAGKLLQRAARALVVRCLWLANDNLDDAREITQEVVQFTADVLAAKGFVEQNLEPVKTRLEKLQAGLAEAQQSLAALQAEFLPENFEGEPEKFGRAHRLCLIAAVRLEAMVRAPYFGQHFCFARGQLEELNSEVQERQEQLLEISAKLEAELLIAGSDWASLAAAAQEQEKLANQSKLEASYDYSIAEKARLSIRVAGYTADSGITRR